MPSTSQTNAALLSALCSAVGQTIDLDDKGECCLEFADAVEVAIVFPQESGSLSVRAPVADAGPSELETLRRAMSLNYGALPPSYSVALDAGSGQLVLIACLDPEQVTEDGFLRSLGGVLQLVPKLRSYLRDGEPLQADSVHHLALRGM